MTPLVLAHIGHWTTSLAFFGPVIVLPAGLYAAILVERKRGPAEGDDDLDDLDWPAAARER